MKKSEENFSLEELNKQVVKEAKLKKKRESEWYSIRSLLGYQSKGVLMYILLGGRESGKSYAVLDFFLRCYKNKNIPFYWIRLSQNESKKLLNNNADKLIDPDLRRKYHLSDILVNGPRVYEITKRDEKTNKIKEKKLMCSVLAANEFASNKGQGFYDNEYDGWYNICIDEFQLERGTRRTFDVVYSITNTIENLIRSRKEKVRIFFIGNLLESASDLLANMNFIPEKFGRYYLPKKRCLIDYIEPTDKYLNRRKGTIADLLSGEESTFTNKLDIDKSLVYKGKLGRPLYIIKFKKYKDTWFVLYENSVIKRYNGETVNNVIAMRPYLDVKFISEPRDMVIQLFNTRSYLYRDFTTFTLFQKYIEELKPSR